MTLVLRGVLAGALFGVEVLEAGFVVTEFLVVTLDGVCVTFLAVVLASRGRFAAGFALLGVFL
jgi:hypothetical protein